MKEGTEKGVHEFFYTSVELSPGLGITEKVTEKSF